MLISRYNDTLITAMIFKLDGGGPKPANFANIHIKVKHGKTDQIITAPIKTVKKFDYNLNMCRNSKQKRCSTKEAAILLCKSQDSPL